MVVFVEAVWCDHFWPDCIQDKEALCFFISQWLSIQNHNIILLEHLSCLELGYCISFPFFLYDQYPVLIGRKATLSHPQL